MELNLGSVNDALGKIGSNLRSPAFGPVQDFQNQVQGMKLGGQIDMYTMGIAHPDHAITIGNFMAEVDSKTAILEGCGNTAMSILQGATTDYIKNTGIQQAGRDLADKLGGTSDALDCLAGFSTLFASKGIFEESIGLADLPQMQTRLKSIILDATNPNKLSNLLMNMDAVTGIMTDIQGVCDAMNAGFAKLAADDLATIAGTLNKLAQWAAFAKIANSDPCALVTNKKMLSHFTNPVVDDIISLYDKATSGLPALADFVDVNSNDFLNPLAGINPNFNQDPMGGLLSFDKYTEAAGSAVDGVVGAVGVTLDGMFDSSASLFSNNKDTVEFLPLLSKGLESTTLIGVGSCAGGDSFASMTKAECYSKGGHWQTDMISGSEFGLASGVSSLIGGFGSFVNDVASELSSGLGLPAVSIPSGKDASRANNFSAQSHSRVPAFVSGASPSTFDGTSNSDGLQTMAQSFAASAPASGSILQDVPTNIAGVVGEVGAKLQNVNDFGSGGFDSLKSAIKSAESSGNYSNFTVFRCVGGGVTDTDEETCISHGGTWSSQSGTKFNTNKVKNIISGGMNSSSVNKELQTILPTTKAFDISKIA